MSKPYWLPVSATLLLPLLPSASLLYSLKVKQLPKRGRFQVENALLFFLFKKPFQQLFKILWEMLHTL